MKDIRGKTALVTGAGSGIGRATAAALAREGTRLVLCDVNAQALDTVVAEIGRDACLLDRVVDVSNREAMRAFAEEVHALVPAVDILVNNAGVYVTGGVLDLSLDDWDWVISIDLWGIIHGIHYFVPPMARRGTPGHVVNMSSMCGFWVAPRVTGYLTAKFGVFGLSEALREDLRGTGIGVTTACPGMINTNLIQTTRLRHAKDEQEQRAHLEQTYLRRNYGPEKVARGILNAIRRNRRLALISPEARIMYYMERFCPSLSRVIARSAMRRMLE
ncbi:MAG: hypothetical protein QG656_2596 [Candidatus Hydrogenedentes bacterium]|nr:hypothetical protein [Candidatus Hydrogenedentota bacterium]